MGLHQIMSMEGYMHTAEGDYYKKYDLMVSILRRGEDLN